MPEDVAAASIFEPGRTCWRVAWADRLGLVVDGAAYFRALREALIAARQQVMLIGWDFDFEIEMLPGESDGDGMAPDGYPNVLGEFLEALVARAPDLDLWLLKWNGALLVAPGRLAPTIAIRVFSHARIHFALDGHHPLGACHHQKIVVVDDALAFCGGIDTTELRWDTAEHAPEDPRRVMRDGSPAPPWHDATTALAGPVARALGDLSRTRWERATGDRIAPPRGLAAAEETCWPSTVAIDVEDVDVAIARTEPPFGDDPLVNEIEELYLALVRGARRIIYIESQYFTTETVCRAIEARLQEPGGPEVVVINPMAALGALEDRAMHPLRGRVIRRLHRADREGRFRIFYPVNAAERAIYVHAKVVVVDDRWLRMGSSNLDDRSMGFDTECDVAFEGGDEATRAAIDAFRHRLLAEHLGVEPADLARAENCEGSMVAAIEALRRPHGRGLRVIACKKEDWLSRVLANTRLLDPRYHPGEPSRAGRFPQPRHVMAGFALLGAAALLWRAGRRRSR